MTDELAKFAKALLRDPASNDVLKAAYNSSQKFRFADYIDLEDLLLQVSNDNPSSSYVSEARNTIASIKDLVVMTRAQGPLNKSARGLSVYFPQPYLFDAEYSKLAFAKPDFGWIELIAAYSNPKKYDMVDRLRVLYSTSAEQLSISPDRLEFEKKNLERFVVSTTKSLTPQEGAKIKAGIDALQLNIGSFRPSTSLQLKNLRKDLE